MPRLIPVCSVITIPCIAAASAQADEPWQFQIAPYVWAAGLDGDVATLRVNASAQTYYNVEHPDFGPDWSLRLQMQILFPK